MTTGIGRPAPIRFTDLAAPVYPDAALPIRAGLADYGATLELRPQAMLAAAAERTGLTDWGATDFLERMEVLCTALRDEAELSDTGKGVVFEQLVGNLVNRLRLQALVTAHPEIDDVVIERPIIICGLPRTGTTHLHNLLAADPGLRHLPYWESLEPFPGPDDSDDARRERCAAGLDLVNTSMPEFRRMHDMTVDHAHEEIQLLANDISGMLFETTYHVPSFAAHYRSHDQTPSYGYLKRSLKAMQWLRGGTRWVLKSPQHLEQFPLLRNAFPDATFVVTHRDPVDVVQSMLTMICYASRMSVTRPQPAKLAAYWLDRIADLLGGCVAHRDVLPADQSIDVRFEDFMADEQGTLRALYRLAGQPFDGRARSAMQQFLATHPRGQFGGVRYDLADFGLDRAEVARRFAAYRSRFVDDDPRDCET